jgi:hypothetical protein
VAETRRPTLMARIARLRVALGFASGAVVLALARPTAMSLVVGMSIALCGEAIRVWASGHLNKSREVTSSGPYRWCPHPLYLGSSVMGVGLAVASGGVAVSIVIAVYLLVTLTAAIRSEEAFLRGAFPDQYDRYRRGRDAAGGIAGAHGTFSLGQAIANREHRALIGLLVALLLLVLKATYNGMFWRAAAGRP